MDIFHDKRGNFVMKNITKSKNTKAGMLRIFVPIFISIAFCLVLIIVLPSFSSNGNDKNGAVGIESNNKSTSVNNIKRVDKSDWRLLLVNQDNPLPDHYNIELTQLKNGQAVDKRCYPDLQKMMDDCRKAGNNPLICSSYRTQKKQERLFNNQIQKWTEKGYSKKDAEIEAGKVVAVPGTSEHQLGLAVDIVDRNNQNLDTSQEKTSTQKWLIKNSWKYGFILRYPNDKKDVTKIIYEPWHYRYVGKTAAKEIYEQGICLEEYLQQ